MTNAWRSRMTRTVAVSAMLCLAAATARAQTATGRVVRAANAFLATLDSAQRQRVLFRFDDAQQRVRWSNLPVQMVKRAGLSMGELSATQRTAAMAMLSSAL